ncbi:MAG: phosphatase PAP2 family protein [Candidatus Hydrogenedentes bacterium]|nr:phosphatase PAP2 family protein [Candidatus Hydrogenedentota bacterium]
MIIKTGTFREHALAWPVFLAIFGVLFGVTLFFGRFVDAAWDINLLLFLNPDAYIPVLDELIIMQTDFALLYLVVIPLAWVIGYYITRNRPTGQKRARRVLHVLGIVFAVWYGMGMFVHDKGIFYWSEYEYPMVFLPLALILLTGFYFAGNLYLWLDDENQAKLAHAFWLTLLALFFVNALGEDTIKEWIGRPRPLNDANAAWNGGIRQLNDEIVRGSYSYISGHTSSFWAQTIIYFMLIKSWKFRAPLLLLGCFHGFTRIYTAAHFPYCVIMATFFGITVTASIYHCLWNHRHLPLIAMLLLSFTLYSLNQNPLLPGIIAVITIAWFLLYQYRHRNAPSYTPLDNALAWGGKG